MFKFSKASYEKLKGVHPDLVKVMEHAIQNSPVDFRITQGVRTQEEQDALYAQGRTKPGQIVTWTRKSRHITGHAVDVVALVNGKISWEIPYYRQIADTVKEVAVQLGIMVDCGADWVKNKDYPHIELEKSRYP